MSKKQTITASGTPAAEVSATDLVVRRLTLPHHIVLDAVVAPLQHREVVPMFIELDATTAMQSIVKGDAQADLKYMSKYPGVHFGFLCDLIGDERNACKLSHVPSADNTSDIHTKALEFIAFSRHRKTLGIMYRNEVGHHFVGA